MRFHPEAQAYVACREGSAQGRTPREIKHCLKRFVARRLYPLLVIDEVGYIRFEAEAANDLAETFGFGTPKLGPVAEVMDDDGGY